MDSKRAFKNQIQIIYADFIGKMEQGALCQLQDRLLEAICEDAKKMDIIRESAAIGVYDSNAAKLVELGKTYRNVLEEKLFTDGYRTFEEFISSVFKTIFTIFPYLLVNDKEIDSKELKIPFQHIFEGTMDLEAYKAFTIESRVKTYMQGDNILKILERFKTTFFLKMNLTDIQKLECQRSALLRNMIAHNNSIINQIYIKSIVDFKIKENYYSVGESLLPHLETEINKQRDTFKGVTEQIIKDLESDGNLTTLDMKNTDNKNKILNS